MDNTSTYSLTQAGNLTAIAGAIVIVLKLVGVDVPAEDVATVLAAIAIIAGPIISWIGRYRQGDVSVAGFKLRR